MGCSVFHLKMDKEATSEQKLNKTLAEKSSKQTSATNSAQCSSADAKEKEDESVAEKCKKFEADADHLDPISAGEYSNESSTSQSGLDCPVCLQSAAYPVRLPCQHVFCFLCIKGKRLEKISLYKGLKNLNLTFFRL